MRNPDRIDRIIEKLRLAWHQQPDMRLGQLIFNITRGQGDIWYIEDERDGYKGPFKQIPDDTTRMEELIDLFGSMMHGIDPNAEVVHRGGSTSTVMEEVSRLFLGKSLDELSELERQQLDEAARAIGIMDPEPPSEV